MSIEAFANRVNDWIEESGDIREGLDHYGHRLVESMCVGRTLRQLARDSGLSPTYLSQVNNERVIISPHAFARLWRLRRQSR